MTPQHIAHDVMGMVLGSKLPYARGVSGDTGAQPIVARAED
jgi:1-deoxy-D-xylulose-5-phosphate synthase